jgi:hypothetical protein
LRKSLDVSAVYKPASTRTQGVVTVNSSLVEGASSKRRSKINVIAERICPFFAYRPFRAW